MRNYFLLCIILLLSTGIKAQTTEDSVKSAVMLLFTAMKNSDAELLKSAFTDSAILQTIYTDKAGKVKLKTEPVSAFAEFLGKQKKGSLDEQIVFDMIKTDGNLASVWTPYQFYFNGTFSHCGVNSFQLIRTQNVWKIHFLIDTRRKINCN